MPIDRKSLIRHNNIEGGYKDAKLETVRKQNEDNTRNLMQYDDDKPIGKLLDENPNIQVCVDIGCGLGWAAELMSQTREVVHAIEPSVQALDLAKKLYVGVENIKWINGFAEDELPKLTLTSPTFFNTLCVLSHLEDEAVLAICALVDKAPPGSVLSFSELWGEESSHAPWWHTRTKEWWKAALPSFDLEFIKRPCQGRFKSFTGKK